MRNSYRIAAVLCLLLVAAAAVTTQSHAQPPQIITIRTGQSGGAPGSCGAQDDCFRYVSTPNCGVPLSNVPFTAADFAAARSGPFAHVISAQGLPWTPTLNCDPDARWINSEIVPGACFGNPQSVLYACEFNVTGLCPPTARVEVCWLVDDVLGDQPGPNPIGVYIGPISNTIALNPTFAGGNYGTETTASQTSVPLALGSNWLYVYQRDLGCAVSGLNLQATITIDPCIVPTEESSWGEIKALF